MEVLSKLDNFKSTHIARRVKREYAQLKVVYDSINIDISDDNEVIIDIQVNCPLNDKDNTYRFVLTHHYPFHPPKIFVNNKPYIRFLTLPSARFTKVYNYINGPRCLCCSSISLNHNWSPALTMNNLLKEIDIIKQSKYEIVIKLLTDIIKRDYLIMDIDLDSYLFDVSNPFILF